MITFQLLSKDGSSLDDAEVLSGRWQAYVEGFVSEVETPGVPTSKVRRPFLRRSVIHPTAIYIPTHTLTIAKQVSTHLGLGCDKDGRGRGRARTRLLRARRAGDQSLRADLPSLLCLEDRGRAVARALERRKRARGREARREGCGSYPMA